MWSLLLHIRSLYKKISPYIKKWCCTYQQKKKKQKLIKYLVNWFFRENLSIKNKQIAFGTLLYLASYVDIEHSSAESTNTFFF